MIVIDNYTLLAKKNWTIESPLCLTAVAAPSRCHLLDVDLSRWQRWDLDIGSAAAAGQDPGRTVQDLHPPTRALRASETKRSQIPHPDIMWRGTSWKSWNKRIWIIWSCSNSKSRTALQLSSHRHGPHWLPAAHLLVRSPPRLGQVVASVATPFVHRTSRSWVQNPAICYLLRRFWIQTYDPCSTIFC